MSRFGDPETGWVHRIDWVPELGRLIEFRRDDGRVRAGWVVEPKAADTSWQGIGDDVRIHLGADTDEALLIPSQAYTHWRYVA